MNPNPRTAGISKYWKAGEDDRCLLAESCGLEPGQIDAVLLGLGGLLATRRRTKLVGFGVFEWLPWRRRIPTGRVVETWKLAFRPSRYARKFKGDETNGSR